MARRERVLVGLDIGTSAVDACAFRLDGTPIAMATVPLAVVYPRRGWAEQDVASWASAALAALRGLAAALGPAAAPAAIGLAGQCPSIALVRDDGVVLTPGLIYQDNRATVEAARLAQTLGAERVFRRAGSFPSQFYAAPKVMWLAAHHPELRGSRPWLVQPRDLAAWRLTGMLATDPTHAGCTGLYDLAAGEWASDWVGALDLAWCRLPPLLASGQMVGRLTPAAAVETGFAAGTPVVIGAADNFCSAVALGATRPGILGDTTGTSTCLDLTVTGHSRVAPLSYYAHVAPGALFATVGLNASGAVIAWAASVLAGGDVARLEALASAAPPDAGAPLLLPFLAAGERSDAGAVGAWHGLTLAHDPARLARSVYEGVAFALRELVEHIRAAGYPLIEARVGGGGARSVLWIGLKADIWNLPVRAACHAETTALGAAMLAGVATGLYRDLDDAARQAVRLAPARPPDAAIVARYDDAYARWRVVKERATRS